MCIDSDSRFESEQQFISGRALCLRKLTPIEIKFERMFVDPLLLAGSYWFASTSSSFMREALKDVFCMFWLICLGFAYELSAKDGLSMDFFCVP